MKTSTIEAPPLTLFGLTHTPEAATPELPVTQTPRPALAPAAARLVTTNFPDPADPAGGRRLLLVVDCPFCDAQHIHPGGHEGAPWVCIRRSRCVGAPGGSYFFPVVHQ